MQRPLTRGSPFARIVASCTHSPDSSGRCCCHPYCSQEADGLALPRPRVFLSMLLGATHEAADALELATASTRSSAAHNGDGAEG